jgi:hypothetical protein
METTTKRRHRSTRTSTGARIRVQARDIAVFKALFEHGPLPTPYLYEFAKHLSPSYAGLKMRLTDLFHEEETEHGGAYLWRPGEDYNAVTKYEHEIHDITRYAEQALEEHGHQLTPRTFENGLNAHRFMVACTSASLEIAVNANPALRWQSRGDLLRQSPNPTLKIACTIAHDGQTSTRRLIPDDVFGIEYVCEQTYYRLFAVEDDRGNEPYKRANLEETSYLAKILRYRQVIERGVYKDHFGRKCGMLVLNITTTTSHMQGIIDLIMEMTDGKGLPYMLFKVVPCFGKKLAVPPVMRELLTTPWHRAAYPDIDISKPR